jgi:hypothetical protein
MSARTYQPFCLALVLAFAVQIGWSLAVGTVVEVWTSMSVDDEQSYTSESLVLTGAGEPVIQRTTTTNYPEYKWSTEFFDAETRAVREPETLTAGAPVQLVPSLGFGRDRWDRIVQEFGESYYDVPHSVGAVTAPDNDWQGVYFVIADAAMSRGYFELFDTSSRERLGYLGTGGFRETPPPAEEQFEAEPRDQSYVFRTSAILWHRDLEQLRSQINQQGVQTPVDRVSDSEPGFPFHPGQCIVLTGGRPLLVDIRERSTTPICPETDVSSIGLICPAGVGADGRHTLLIAARTADTLLLLHPHSGARTEYPLPADLSGRDLTVHVLPEGGLVLQQYASPDTPTGLASGTSYGVNVWWLSRQGEVSRQAHYQLSLSGGQSVSETASMNLIQLIAGAPLVAAVVDLAFIPAVGPWGDEPSYWEALPGMLRLAWPGVLLVLMCGAGLAWWTDRQRTQARLPRCWGWIAFVFLFGLPGYLGYRLHRQWPVRKLAPAPVRTGIEVFAT